MGAISVVTAAFRFKNSELFDTSTSLITSVALLSGSGGAKDEVALSFYYGCFVSFLSGGLEIVVSWIFIARADCITGVCDLGWLSDLSPADDISMLLFMISLSSSISN